MVELRFDHKLIRTIRGTELLKLLSVVTPEEIAYVEADIAVPAGSLPAAAQPIQALLDSLNEESLRTRRTPSSLYVPKGRGSVADTLASLRMQVEVMAPDGTKGSFVEFCRERFNSAEASARAGLDTLRNFGLIQQTGFDTYAATPEAKSWLESGEPLDLIRVVHANLRCVVELLMLMSEPRSVGELTSLVSSTYGVKLNDGALRIRLQLLRECDLVRQATATTYQTTARGTAFSEVLPVEEAKPFDLEPGSPTLPATAHPAPRALIDELRDAAQDAKQPARFEAAVAAALRTLGLHAIELGGPGDTDVLVTVRNSPTTQTKIIVDAKATSHSSVLEGAIDFTTLEEHRLRHKADRVALVGIGFDAGRTMKRANDQGVALISVDQLAQVIDRHQTSPLTPIELLALFGRDGQEEMWTAADRRTALITAVIRAVAEEAEYVEEAGEGFTSKDIHKTIRRVQSPTPSQEDVAAVLELLASPLLGGIVSDGKGTYHPAAPAEALGARLQAIAQAAYAAEAE
jgi:Restriction endonuclease